MRASKRRKHLALATTILNVTNEHGTIDVGDRYGRYLRRLPPSRATRAALGTWVVFIVVAYAYVLVVLLQVIPGQVVE